MKRDQHGTGFSFRYQHVEFSMLIYEMEHENRHLFDAINNNINKTKQSSLSTTSMHPDRVRTCPVMEMTLKEVTPVPSR